MQLASEIARLADAAERLLERDERRERRARHDRLREQAIASRPPAHFGLGVYLQAIPGIAALFERVVPDDYVAQVEDGEYEVACPCGETPTVKTAEIGSCSCGRWFLHDGEHVRVALTPAPESSAQAEAEAR